MEEELRAVLDGRGGRDVDDGGRVCGGGNARDGGEETRDRTLRPRAVAATRAFGLAGEDAVDSERDL